MAETRLCKVEWCAAFATKGEYCPVHRLDPALHPDYCAPGEVATDDTELLKGMDCPECDGEGETECEECIGSGECTCSSCDAYHDCGQCEGQGTIPCEDCDGSGVAEGHHDNDPNVYVPQWAEVRDEAGRSVIRRVKKRDQPVRWTPDVYDERTRKRATA